MDKDDRWRKGIFRPAQFDGKKGSYSSPTVDWCKFVIACYLLGYAPVTPDEVKIAMEVLSIEEKQNETE